MITNRQEQIINILKNRDSMTASEIANEMNVETKSVSAHLRKLEDIGQIYVSEWRKGKFGVPTKTYKLGHSESVAWVRTKKQKKKPQDASLKVFNKRNIFDPDAPIMPNNGWVSTIHSKDYMMQHGEHIKFMERFQPRPDPAAVWLFNEPKVDLQGAKYD
jgi:predicted transcriptional regulator